jgi:hypothetical protein
MATAVPSDLIANVCQGSWEKVSDNSLYDILFNYVNGTFDDSTTRLFIIAVIASILFRRNLATKLLDIKFKVGIRWPSGFRGDESVEEYSKPQGSYLSVYSEEV